MSASDNSLQSISKFFFASSAEEMCAAYETLSENNPAPTVDDWSAVEFCFNHLFVGPRALLAPPYASVYLDGNPARVMGETTGRMRDLYEMIGLVSPWLDHIPDDHLALELDALWQIEDVLQRITSPELEDVRGFLLAHLRGWMPLFTARIRAVDDVHPAILHIADQLEATLAARDLVAAFSAA